MTVSFDGQVALVTGAGRGLGRGYALELARLGAQVVVNDLGGEVDGSSSSRTPAEEVCEEIRAAGGQAVPNFDSVASMEGGAGMVKTALDTWGRLDAIVCNAGILRDRTIMKTSEDDWDSVMNVHIKGCFTVLHAAWPVFREQAYGRAVFATSSTGMLGNFGQGNYGAAKAAMLGLMNVAKLEGEKYNINVHLISPGGMTRMTEGLISESDPNRMDPQHVAPAVAYLASRDCRDSGLVIEAVGGRYRRNAVVTGPGVEFDPSERKDADWVAANWEQIISLEGCETWWNMRETWDKHRARAREESR